MAKDYYKLLGIERSATENDIKDAFRRLAHRYHPDKSGGDADKFKEINEAYQVLSHKEKRQQYDQFGQTFSAPGGGFSWQGFQHNSQSFGGGAGQTQQFDFGDLSDILGDMFGFGAQARSRGSRERRGGSVQTTTTISFEESFFGTERELSLNLRIQCDNCHATGNDPATPVETCSTCKGSGTLTNVSTTFLGAIQSQSICAACEGAGKRSAKKCAICRGTTLIRANQKIRVKIPAGIDESKTIRLAGKGEAGTYGGPSGDLLISVNITPHTRFGRDGYTIKSSEEIPLSTLTNGGTATVHTLGDSIKLKIPSGTTSGKTFILRHKGFQFLSGSERGDHLVTVHARVPRKLNAKQKKLLVEFERSLADTDASAQWWQ